MTAHAMKGDRERCLAAGMDGYVAKPIDRRELLEVIARIAPRRRPCSRPPPRAGAPADAARRRRWSRADGARSTGRAGRAVRVAHALQLHDACAYVPRCGHRMPPSVAVLEWKRASRRRGRDGRLHSAIGAAIAAPRSVSRRSCPPISAAAPARSAAAGCSKASARRTTEAVIGARCWSCCPRAARRAPRRCRSRRLRATRSRPAGRTGRGAA